MLVLIVLSFLLYCYFDSFEIYISIKDKETPCTRGKSTLVFGKRIVKNESTKCGKYTVMKKIDPTQRRAGADCAAFRSCTRSLIQQ